MSLHLSRMGLPAYRARQGTPAVGAESCVTLDRLRAAWAGQVSRKNPGVDRSLVLAFHTRLESADGLAQSLARVRKLLRPEDEQRDDADHDQLRKSYASHGVSLSCLAVQAPGNQSQMYGSRES